MIERSFLGQTGSGLREFLAERIKAEGHGTACVSILVPLQELAARWDVLLPGCKTFTPRQLPRLELSGPSLIVVDELSDHTFRKIRQSLHETNTLVWLMNRELP